MAGQQSFSASIDEWVAATEKRMVAVFRMSAQYVIRDMQTPVSAGGRMRVDTGFLRASMVAVLNGLPPQAARDNPGGSYAYDEGRVTAVIAGASLGDFITAGYTAKYALPREYGANGQPPDAFVRTAAAKWRQIVAQVTQEAKARVASR